MRTAAILLAAAVAAVAGCHAARSRAAEPTPALIQPAIYRPTVDHTAVKSTVYVEGTTPEDGRATQPIQLVSDTQPARFPLARGVVDCFRVRVPNPCPRLAPCPLPTPPADPEKASEAAIDEKPEESGDDFALAVACIAAFSLIVGFGTHALRFARI